MKSNIYLWITLAFFSLTTLHAQSPNLMSYQAVIWDAGGNLVADKEVNIRLSILQGVLSGPAVFVETHRVRTNSNGLASLLIGGGTTVSGQMSDVKWGEHSFFLKTETDPSGGNNFTISGTTQLVSVPYALYSGVAKTSENISTPSPGLPGQVLTIDKDGKMVWSGATIATLSRLECNKLQLEGNLIAGKGTMETYFQLPYTGGNGGNYSGQIIPSTGIPGLTARLLAGSLNIGSGTLTYSISGIPETSGTVKFEIEIGGGGCIAELKVVDGGVDSLKCADSRLTSSLTYGLNANETSISIPYSGGNGGNQNGASIQSLGVKGLTAELAPGLISQGNGEFNFIVKGIPEGVGQAEFTLSIAGKSCKLTWEVQEGTANALECLKSVQTGKLVQGFPAAEVNIAIPYKQGNGGSFLGRNIASSGIIGLTAKLEPGRFIQGDDSLRFTISGTPMAEGVPTFKIEIGTLSCSLPVNIIPLASVDSLNCDSIKHYGRLSPGVEAQGEKPAL